jgi:hypothetical protein
VKTGARFASIENCELRPNRDTVNVGTCIFAVQPESRSLVQYHLSRDHQHFTSTAGSKCDRSWGADLLYRIPIIDISLCSTNRPTARTPSSFRITRKPSSVVARIRSARWICCNVYSVLERFNSRFVNLPMYALANKTYSSHFTSTSSSSSTGGWLCCQCRCFCLRHRSSTRSLGKGRR